MPALEMTVENNVATLLLNRPEAKNALSPEMADELEAALSHIARNRDIRAVILTGAGGAFCAGGDVRAMNASAGKLDAEGRRNSMMRHHINVRALAALDRPVIAAVEGVAYGAGFSLALLADIVLASPRARFCMAFARIGLVPDYGALYTLPRIVGIARAKEIMFSAREIGAEEAHDLGIALEVVPGEGLMDRAREMAAAFANASPLALSLTKSALNNSLGSDFNTMLDVEATAQGAAGLSDYARESFRRFAEKQPARFVWPARKN